MNAVHKVWPFGESCKHQMAAHIEYIWNRKPCMLHQTVHFSVCSPTPSSSLLCTVSFSENRGPQTHAVVIYPCVRILKAGWTSQQNTKKIMLKGQHKIIIALLVKCDFKLYNYTKWCENYSDVVFLIDVAHVLTYFFFFFLF